jgi:glycosidase
MFFTRGQPVIYYGDEQGFTGDNGGDKNAREDMFPSLVASYNDNTLIGTTKTTADDNFNPSHPMYKALKEYAKIYSKNKELILNGLPLLVLNLYQMTIWHCITRLIST